LPGRCASDHLLKPFSWLLIDKKCMTLNPYVAEDGGDSGTPHRPRSATVMRMANSPCHPCLRPMASMARPAAAHRQSSPRW
jgi:hypothetical protein